MGGKLTDSSYLINRNFDSSTGIYSFNVHLDPSEYLNTDLSIKFIVSDTRNPDYEYRKSIEQEVRSCRQHYRPYVESDVATGIIEDVNHEFYG